VFTDPLPSNGLPLVRCYSGFRQCLPSRYLEKAHMSQYSTSLRCFVISLYYIFSNIQTILNTKGMTLRLNSSVQRATEYSLYSGIFNLNPSIARLLPKADGPT
jgi:hypothetical protein